MKAVSCLSLLTWILLTSLCPTDSSAQAGNSPSYRLAVQGPGVVHHSRGPSASAKAATDSFYIYGGPGTVEGRFQTELVGAGGAPDPQGWVGVDLTEIPSRWRAGTTNAESVADGNPQGFTGGVDNHAAIATHTGPDYTGVGNNWDEWLVFRYDLSAANPAFNPDTDSSYVQLTCEYKHDTMPNYDYLIFDWKRGAEYRQLVEIDNKSFNEVTGNYETRIFDSDDHGGVAYGPGDYVNGTEVYLRVRIHTDGGWSDEDFLWPTEGRGAAAVDNIAVYVDGAPVSLADWEHVNPKDELPDSGIEGHDNGSGLGTEGWVPVSSDFVGDFSKIFTFLSDSDLCRDNITPQFTFINDGSSPNNCPGCPISPAISPFNCYFSNCYVVDFNGGLTNGAESLSNDIWSPEIDYNPPDTETNGGVVLGFTRWTDMPLVNGIFAVWNVRSYGDLDGEVGTPHEWSDWKSNNFVYYSAAGAYGNFTVDVTHLITQSPDKVQIALGVRDLAEAFAFPGSDATPSPYYDNVYLKKYSVRGPVITSRTIDLASDCFPVDGTLIGSCRFDANIDRNAYALVPGDSIVAEIKPTIPGSALADPMSGGDMVVLHRVNPQFAADRATGFSQVGAVWLKSDPNNGWDIYYYRVSGQPVTSSTGEVVEGRYFWDLPDGTSNGLPHITDEAAVFFPGDVIHFYLEVDDDLGNRSTLPADIMGADNFSYATPYSRVHTVRGLPSVQLGVQPRILFWNDAGHGDAEQRYLDAFACNGMIEGSFYDTYTTKGPSSGVGNGLGSAGFHGATAAQLDGYDAIIYALGNLSSISISDGSGIGDNDLSADLATMEAWANADADRFHAYFGDDFAESMVQQGAACESYLNNVLGVRLLSVDVRPAIDDQTTPLVLPSGLGSASYLSQWVSYGGCLVINDFDEIGAFGVGPVLVHEFTDPAGNPYPSSVAGSIEWQRIDGNGKLKHSTVFPYDLSFVFDAQGSSGPWPAWAALMYELLASWGMIPTGVPVPGSVCYGNSADNPIPGETHHRFAVAQNHPNPFNPRTRIRFTLERRERVKVAIYNVRGELVAQLLNEARDAGPQFVDWEGRDQSGAEVASGVYFYRVATDSREETRKMALLR